MNRQHKGILLVPPGPYVDAYEVIIILYGFPIPSTLSSIKPLASKQYYFTATKIHQLNYTAQEPKEVHLFLLMLTFNHQPTVLSSTTRLMILCMETHLIHYATIVIVFQVK